MEKVTDWLTLWKEVSYAQKHFWENAPHRKPKQTPSADKDGWKTKAEDYDAMVRKRWARPDSSRDHVLGILKQHPGASVLDIGAGTGAWSLLMARHAGRVTALEPSGAMREVMTRNARKAGLKNLTIIDGSWPEAQVERHDFTLASHSMYGCDDFKTFIRRMEQVTRNTCFLVIRILLTDSLMARISNQVWGQPYDSPNFQIAFNALLQMGIYANVLVETPDYWKPWTHETLEKALSEVVARFDLSQDSPHVQTIEKMLRTHLIKQNKGYTWPPGTRSAVIYWKSSTTAVQSAPRKEGP